MAALKYISQFESYAGAKYQLSIYDEDGTGSTETFKTGPNGFDLIYEGDISDPWKPSVPSRVEFSFNVEDQDGEDFVIACATAAPGRFKIYVTESSSAGVYTDALFWQGFLQGEGIEISDQAFPYEVQLTATDISFFDEIPYNEGITTTGVGTGVDHVLNVLDFSGYASFATAHGFDEIFQTTINWRGVSMASGGDPLEKTGIDYHTFYNYDSQNAVGYNSCREVVESIAKLFGSRFVQSRGLFRLQQYDGLVETTNAFFNYENDKTLSNSGTVDENYEIDLAQNFRLGGGSYSFNPGVKSAEREYKYRRNYLEGKSADQDNPLSYVIGDIPLLNYLVSSQAPRFTLKFTLTYKILDIPDIGTGGVLGRGWTSKNNTTEFINFVPLWRVSFFGTGGTDGNDWWFSQAMAQRDPYGFEFAGPSLYGHILGGKSEWTEERPQYTGWEPVLPEWKRADLNDPEDLYFEIIDDEDYPMHFGEVGSGDYEAEERTITVEITIPYFGAPGTPQDIQDLTFAIDAHDMYNRYAQEWLGQDPTETLSDYLEWKVEGFELIVHGDTLEEKPETARKYKVESPDAYRKRLELDDNILTGLDKRTWHSIQVWNGSAWQDGQLWYRQTDSLNFKLLNYLSVREQVAMNRYGLRLYQGGLVTRSESLPAFHSIIESAGKRYMMIAGTFVARNDEWRSVTMIELSRDESDLVYTEIKTEGAGTSSSLPGGNYTEKQNVGGVTYAPPLYEYATGLTASAYTISGFGLQQMSAYSDAEINQVLWVFQDSTKLIHGKGYTLSGQILTFTYDLENADLEVYYYG